MRGQQMLEMMGNINPAYIEEAYNVPQKKNSQRFKKIAATAACFVLILSVSFGAYSYAAEAKEYKAAIQFFSDYGLSADGLTRGEIKEIYRDVTTKSFSYVKTAEVIQESISTNTVGGYEISSGTLTPEDIESLWNYKNYSGNFYWSEQEEEKYYKYRNEYDDNGAGDFIKSYVEKYDGEALVWSAPLDEIDIWGCRSVSDGVIIYGETVARSEEEKSYPCFVKLNGAGNVLWEQILDNGFKWEYIADVLENNDGSYAVFSRGERSYFCLSQYTAEGERILFKKTDVGNYGIWNAAKFNDGYIVQLGSFVLDEYARIVKVDREGNITDSFTYSDEEYYYYINDMTEFNGRIYLSAYAVPKLSEGESDAGGRYEIAAVLNYLHDNEIYSISSEELTPLVKEQYMAVLLVCDGNSGVPKEFFSVEGEIGGQLKLSDSGTLLWDASSLVSTFYSPMTSSFTIGGTGVVYRYTFDAEGVLISRENTGEVTAYRR